ncbi:Flavin-linked sulfhydryl oxidase of the mitochondrial IMS [Dimargaris xerosporica]|nr:Flavin-linked sulfhydryl oxidase of the mitochondrial IMS [Dimargaris xerosporica]
MVHADASSGQPINPRQTFAKATDGPPGITVLGRSMWTFLHSMAAAYPDQPTAPERDSMQQFLESFTKVHPSLYCRDWFAQKMTDKPPPLDSRKELAQWLCHLHNDINEALGKQLFNCDQVDQRWGDEAI